MRVFWTLLFPIVVALSSKEVSEDVVAFQGIPYARPPVGVHRFEESESIKLSEDLPLSWKRCLNNKPDIGKGENCLYLSVYRNKEQEKKANTLVLITNEDIDSLKVSYLVTEKLNVVVASVREGVLSSFGNAPYGVSDVISLFAFLRDNSEILLIGDITVWAEGSLAETVAAAQHKIDAKKAILINGNAISRTFEREKYGAMATYKLRTSTECDLPSFDQSVDCLRSKPIEELLEKTKEVVASFKPFGDPFRSPRGYIPHKTIPTMLGLYKNPPKDYPDQYDFDVNYTYKNFKQFLAALLPDSMHQNAPLLRRMILHQYIHSVGDKKDTYFLYQQSREILLDRDFRVPVQQIIDHYVRFKNKLWVFEYGVDSTTPFVCLQASSPENISPFCERMTQYFTRFATLGAPTAESCDPKNPTFPVMGGAKRPYFVILREDGVPEWEYNFHKPSCELWINLLPSLDNLELTGRRDAQFEEEEEVDPLEVEDDVQVWHEKAGDDKTELTEEKALNDMPLKMEL